MLITERLRLKPLHKQDKLDIYSYLSDERVMRYFTEGTYTLDETEKFIEKSEDSLFRAVERKSDGKIIGHISFEPWFQDHTYEIGWIFSQEVHNQGYGTEAAQVLMDNAFMTIPKLHRVVATCQPENTASWKVMEHLGMRREGLFLECIPIKDGWWDEYYYAILRREWEQQKKH